MPTVLVHVRRWGTKLLCFILGLGYTYCRGRFFLCTFLVMVGTPFRNRCYARMHRDTADLRFRTRSIV